MSKNGYLDEEKQGYTPTGTYLDAGLSAADKAAVEDLGRQWAEYQASGDQVGMDRMHQQAEAIRSRYGYSGGGDGSEYIALPKEEQKASTPGDWIGGGGAALGGGGKGSVGSWDGGKFTYEQAPQYASKYKGKIDELTAQILGRAAFEYDPEKDPTYQQYKESYTRNGQRAMEDTLGQVSARTGGLASSYAGSVAQQAYDQYMSSLADKIPELRQLAYQMYQDEINGERADLSMLMGLDESAYNKFLTALGQYNTDRGFDYGMFGDSVSRDQWQKTFDRGVLESDRDFLYEAGRDQIADKRYGAEWDYKVEQDALAHGDQDRQEAVSRIYNHLQAGGSVEGLPPDLVQQSGLSTMELEALASDFSKQRSQSDQKFEADLAESKASAAAKYASAAKTSGRSGSGKSGAGGTAGKWDDVEDWVSRFGEDSAEDYIKEKYKDLGYSNQSMALAAWNNHVLESGGTEAADDVSGGEGTAEPMNESEFDAFLNSFGRQYSGQPMKAAHMIWNLFDSGRLTEEQYDRVTKVFGFSN